MHKLTYTHKLYNNNKASLSCHYRATVIHSILTVLICPYIYTYCNLHPGSWITPIVDRLVTVFCLTCYRC